MPKLTNKTVDMEPAPPKGSKFLYDSEIVGFAARVFAPTARHLGGARSFVLIYRVNGVERRHTIGARPVWSVEAARERAKELRREVDKGRDPAVEKREARTAPTIEDLIQRYVDDHLPTTKAATGQRAQGRKAELAIVGDELGLKTKVAVINHSDIVAMHQRITKSRGPIRANRILAYASKMFSMALVPRAGETIAWRTPVQGNPCARIKKNPENRRGRFLEVAELARLADALAALPRTASDCIRFIMLTGARPSEAMQAKWDQFAVDEKGDGSWTKQASGTKQGKTHIVPLGPPALELLDRLRAKRGNSEWAFPSPRDAGKPIGELDDTWHAACERAGLTGARIYDLRHSFASTAIARGASLMLTGAILGHSSAATTERYAHLAKSALREAIESTSNAIANAGNDGGADVVPIRRGR